MAMPTILEPAFSELCLKLGSLRTALRAVQVSVSGDAPLAAEAHELLLILDETILGAERARKAALADMFKALGGGWEAPK